MHSLDFTHPQTCFELGKSAREKEHICFRLLEYSELITLRKQTEWMDLNLGEDNLRGKRVAYLNTSFDKVIEVLFSEDGNEYMAFLWNNLSVFKDYGLSKRILIPSDGPPKFYLSLWGKNIGKKKLPLRKARVKKLNKYEHVYFLSDGRVVQTTPGMALLFNNTDIFEEYTKLHPRLNLVIGFSDLAEGTDAKLLENDPNIRNKDDGKD